MRVRPPMGMNFKVYDFSNPQTITTLDKKIEEFNKTSAGNDSSYQLSPNRDVARLLTGVISRAAADTAKRPQNVIHTLKVYFDQRAWFQVFNMQQRAQLRDALCTMLASAYTKKKQPSDAARVHDVMTKERDLFAMPRNPNKGNDSSNNPSYLNKK